jgi:hypothetical protein
MLASDLMDRPLGIVSFPRAQQEEGTYRYFRELQRSDERRVRIRRRHRLVRRLALRERHRRVRTVRVRVRRPHYHHRAVRHVVSKTPIIQSIIKT